MTIDIRRVVTGHDQSGKSVVLFDGQPKKKRTTPRVDQALLWVTDTPEDNTKHGDSADRDIGIQPPGGGSIFSVYDFLPEQGVQPTPNFEPQGMNLKAGARHPGMHRTHTVDYAIVMEGEIDMLLDDSEVHLTKGDVVIQRGTNHAWSNRSGKPCKIFFVLIDAAPLA